MRSVSWSFSSLSCVAWALVRSRRRKSRAVGPRGATWAGARHVSREAQGARGSGAQTGNQGERERDPDAPSAGLRPERDAPGLRGAARRGNCACGQWRAVC